MTPDESARLSDLVTALDNRVSERPDILASPIGFVIGSLVGAARTDPVGTWAQLAGFAAVLTAVVDHVRGVPGVTVDTILDSIVPA